MSLPQSSLQTFYVVQELIQYNIMVHGLIV